MRNPLATKRFRLQSGERTVDLIDVETGLPLIEPTLYALKRLRSKHLALNTIEAHLRAIMLFELVLRIHNIDLNARLHAGALLSLSEIEDIVDCCKLRIERVIELLDLKLNAKNNKVISLDPFRRLPRSNKRRAVSSYRDRVAYIRDYVNERAIRSLQSVERDSESYLRLEAARNHTFSMFTARVPSKPKPKKPKVSLSESQIDKLWEVIDPRAEQNPFKGEFVRFRNNLILQWFILLGLRRGELMGIRVEDIDLSEKKVRVERRPDSTSDPRKKEGNAKTISGEIPISDDLLLATHEYLTNPNLRPAQSDGNSPFLFVSRGGSPITNSGIAHIFRKIRESVPELPLDLSPQVCRHTCNHILSVSFDEDGVSDQDEAQRRRVLMRWSPTSEMPDHYNKRRISEKANSSALKAQTEQYAKRSKKENRASPKR
jgi:integrase